MKIKTIIQNLPKAGKQKHAAEASVHNRPIHQANKLTEQQFAKAYTTIADR